MQITISVFTSNCNLVSLNKFTVLHYYFDGLWTVQKVLKIKNIKNKPIMDKKIFTEKQHERFNLY